MMQQIMLSLALASLGQMREIHQDFRAGSRLTPGLKMFGPDLDRTARRDGKGLRITLRKDRKTKGAVGIETQFSISGDFEITLAYEILSVNKPKSGMGAGC